MIERLLDAKPYAGVDVVALGCGDACDDDEADDKLHFPAAIPVGTGKMGTE